MPIPAANREDVLRRSGFQGLEGRFWRGVPSSFTTSTSGGGRINSVRDGVFVYAGSTSGDTGAVIGPQNNSGARIYGGDTEVRVTVVGHLEGSYADYATVGPGNKDGTGSAGVGLDLFNEQFFIEGGNTINLNFGFNGEDYFELITRIAPNGNSETELTFRHNGNEQTETFGSTPFGKRMGRSPVYLKSQGNDDRVVLKYAKYEYIDV